ncbi:hypothetical protein AJ79_09280 [Helicocarpus griseus UAMH5409]|uniref:Murein transglycosylase n=1 Tax=Helicocarpus griseus UAMH5409 TaxID=1447875 RepID=A0A2B7WKS4_9EURO|nr:hypothetical protein AJ79_09280 [Helicocarpus griseus UAMH5409]
MKFTTSVLLTVAAAGSLAAAQPHKHVHRHNHAKRDPQHTEVVVVPGPTIYRYEFEGKLIGKEKACEGIKDGSLQWADPNAPKNACDSEPTVSKPKAGQFFEKPYETPAPPKESYKVEPPKVEKPSISVPSITPPKPTVSPPKGGAGADSDFPDGEIDCSHFPSDYGAIPLTWLGLGGWSGIQYVEITGDVVTHIRTAIRGDKCKDGAMCSYACEPGYQKSQWPSTQGAKGESIGGLKCSDGKLWLTNPSLSKKLCVKGEGGVKVKNTLSETVAVCRTDYPGTESETIPLEATPGSTKPLTCPDAAKYYKWTKKSTSAQYYVNPKGVSIQEGCQWGDPSKPIGNFAPLNIGVGKTDGQTYVSIFQNKPTTQEKLDFNVEVRGDLSGSCKYENGQYYQSGNINPNGCTVQVMSGEATYVFY